MPRTPYDADFYKVHPTTCDPDDLWGQVRRTVGGKPVDEGQIQRIEAAVVAGLDLRPDDVLLDLCCGNGALSERFFARCRGGLGVDFSPPLIATAVRRNTRADVTYVLGDVERWVLTADEPTRYTVALCYGSFSYLAPTSAALVLCTLAERFTGLRAVFLGNLPDRARAAALFSRRAPELGEELRHDTQFGVMRTEAELAALAADAGFDAAFRHMPPEFYASAARYDAVLTPRPRRAPSPCTSPCSSV